MMGLDGQGRHVVSLLVLYVSSILCQNAPSNQNTQTGGYDLHGSYFALRAMRPILSERVDPIIQPNELPSNHVHDIFGASAFSATWSYTAALASKCNNMGPVKDHSNYWFPALYHHSASGAFTHVPPRFSAYYHFETTDNGNRVMFPPGFRIVAGNPMLRHNSTDKSSGAIQWYCYGDTQAQNVIQTGSFPDAVTNCPGANGFSGQIWLPFCWDGINEFDPHNPGAHVVYGNGEGPIGGKCTGSAGKHTKALPQLFFEFHHDVAPFAGIPGHVEGKWVLSMGDPTGFGFHADFINGWEDGPRSLSQAIEPVDGDPTKTKCLVGLTGQEAAECFDMLSPAEMQACKIPQARKEDVEGPMVKLPGCNKVQGAGVGDAVMGRCDDGQIIAPVSEPGSGSLPGTTQQPQPISTAIPQPSAPSQLTRMKLPQPQQSPPSTQQQMNNAVQPQVQNVPGNQALPPPLAHSTNRRQKRSGSTCKARRGEKQERRNLKDI